MSDSGTALAVRDDNVVALSHPETFIDFTGASFEQKFAMLDRLCKSNFVPEGYRGKPIDAMIAFDIGTSVGFTFAQSLQSIAVINGRPAIWGDGMLGLVRNSPLCEWIEEVEIGELGTDSYGWRCTAKRRGDPKLITNTFTIRQAKLAKLTTKDKTPWEFYPDRMCKMRARSWTLRDGFADVLKGLAMREEVVDIPPEVRDAIVNAPTRQAAVKAALAARTAIASAVVEDEPPPSAVAAAEADVAAVKPEPVAESTEERIEKALDAAAAQDPDFNGFKGQAARDYVDAEAAGRDVTPAELAAIEQDTLEGALRRTNIRDVLRRVRRLAMTRMPDAPTDEIPPAQTEAAAVTPHENGTVDLDKLSEQQLDKYVDDYALERGVHDQVARIVAVFGEDKRVTRKTVRKILAQIDKSAAEVAA